MKTTWFGIWLLVTLSFLLAGCPPEEVGKKPGGEPPKKVETVVAEKEMVLDSENLPPPRSPLEATPDLHDARLRITDRGMELMVEDGVPDEIVKKLSALKGKNFSNAREFLDAVGGAIGADDLATHQLSILRNSLEQNLAVEPAFPGTQLRLMTRQPGGGASYGTVYFDFDRSEIKPDFINEIRKNAKMLAGDSNLKMVIEGHADERGTTEYNLALGERRANAVKKALIAHGAGPDQVQTVSYGEERPAASGSNEEAWAKNRRGELVPPK